MKYIILLVIVLSTALLASDYAPLKDGKKIGRFILFPCSINYGNHTQNTIFRIDTATGRTWRLMTAADPIGDHDNYMPYEAWEPISEDWESKIKQMPAFKLTK